VTEAFLLKMAKLANLSSRGLTPLSRQGALRLAARGVLFSGACVALLGIAGCESPIALYHQAEGGDIAKAEQPPPGADLPYPNLASVPPAPQALTPAQAAAVQAQLAQAMAAPELPTSTPDPASGEALGGLMLPRSAPPEPDVPGVDWQGLPQPVTPVRPPPPQPAPRAALPDGPPVLLGFQPDSAILNAQGQEALKALAVARGGAAIRVGGFGDQAAMPDAAALTLAVRRARRIADALTAAGVPPGAITLVASAAGSGGFAQLVY
jgi:outer membrane protein OmpA-like peptidoglycan-associated protein